MEIVKYSGNEKPRMIDQAESGLKENRWLSPGRWIIGAAGVSTGLGLIVLLGWYTHNTALIQIHPTLVPMQFNTAIGFLLCGLMLLAYVHDRRGIKITLGAIVTMLGMLTLAQYLLDVDFGIDQLLMEHYITVATSHPGRMAPNTALCFLLISLAMLTPAGMLRQWAAPLQGILGSLVFGLGTVAVLGYWLALESTYGWGRWTHMALHTAIGFMILGLGLFACGWMSGRHSKDTLPRWLPVPVSVAVLTITLTLGLAIQPEQGLATIEHAHDFELVFGIALALTLAMVVNKVVLEKAARRSLEVEIADRKRAEEELRRYEHIVSSSPDMLVLIDTRYVYLAANAAFLDAFGKTPDELIGHTATEIHGADYFNKFIKSHADRCMAGENVRYRSWVEFPAIGRKFMDVSYSVYRDADGEVRGFVTIGRDITESEMLQQQLLQAQKMESVGELAGGLAHDFNNMLGVILGNTELALEQVDKGQSIHAELLEIRKAARRSADLTQQLLAFARQQPIDPTILDLNAAVASMATMLQRLIGSNIELNWQPGSGIWPIRMDPSQIDQILANLCINTQDAIEDVGTVTIETSNKNISAADCAMQPGFKTGEYVLLTVTDDGRGMDQATLDRIYEPFFTTKEMGRGTGLGLAMVYGIVKQNDGFINVHSVMGQGTTFEIYLPRHTVEVAQPQLKNPAITATGGNETILVVEDEAAILKLTATMLRRLGYDVLTAATPRAAIHLVDSHRGEIHLLLTDVIMPGMNGHDLAERLSALLPNLRHLFMSGYTADVITKKGVLDENLYFVKKPFSQQDMAAKIRDALQ